jgi:hypothetical protein
MSRCVGCGKYRFMSRAAAKKARRRMGNPGGMNAYECPTDTGWWHLGHLPGAVRRGDVGRDDLTPPGRPRPPRRRDGVA